MSHKPSLGRGLSAMFPDLMDDIRHPSFVMCGIEELTPNRFQPRKNFNDTDQKSLIESVKQTGIIQPIVVRKLQNGYEIIAGERRWRAAQAASLKEVPVVIREATDRQMAEMSLIENLQRESLNPIEEANAYDTLIKRFELSQEEISSRVGKDRSTIANSLRLLKLPREIKEALIGKVITAGHARAILTLEKASEQLRLLMLIRKKTLSVREAEDIAKKLRTPGKKKNPAGKDIYVADLEKSLSKTLKAIVKIRPGKKTGVISIRYSGFDELDRLVKLIYDLEK
ncbi:MAG: ParB/RepB/Spo0J family partition protein [Syntrophales bacterium]|jgi:ParB family chromosome partitioning protein